MTSVAKHVYAMWHRAEISHTHTPRHSVILGLGDFKHSSGQRSAQGAETDCAK